MRVPAEDKVTRRESKMDRTVRKVDLVIPSSEGPSQGKFETKIISIFPIVAIATDRQDGDGQFMKRLGAIRSILIAGTEKDVAKTDEGIRLVRGDGPEQGIHPPARSM